MTPARLAEIRRFVQRLDLDQLPGWTVEQRIIADLWAEAEAVRALFAGGPDTPCRTTWRPEYSMPDCSAASTECVEVPLDELRAVLDGPNPYRDGERQ